MKQQMITRLGALVVAAAGLLATGCELPTAVDEPTALDATTLALGSAATQALLGPAAADHTTGAVWAKWQECDQGDGHGDELTTQTGTLSHDDGDCQSRRPARDFFLRVTAHDTTPARGSVELRGTEEYEGIWFRGSVTWYAPGLSSNEAFFGGPIEAGNVGGGCYLVGVQDNSAPAATTPQSPHSDSSDRIHYRLYGSSQSPCHQPDHFPKGFPATAYRGNVQVHSSAQALPAPEQ